MSDDVTKIELPYLFHDRDRHGNVRWYVRLPPERRKVRIRAELGSEAFHNAYWAIRNGQAPEPAAKRVCARPGSFRWLAEAYLASPDFKALDRHYTQRERRRVLDPLVEQIGDKPAVIEPRVIREAARSKDPAAAKKFMAALRAVYSYAIDAELVSTDPTAGIRARRPKSDGWHTWTLAECLQFEKAHPIGTMARTAYAVGIYLAARRSDAVKLGRPMERGDTVTYTQEKNRNRAPVRITQPIVPALREALNACQGKGLTWLETQYGRPFTIAGFGNRFHAWCIEADLPHCSFHGLRKATAARMAEAGASSRQIMAVLGDKTLQQAEVYTRGADNARMAKDALGGLYGEQIDPPAKSVGQKRRKSQG